ncbi:hypothetical protein HanPSC8_Chr15g0675711 [Helianthus annuus]|nr:hypothetical protein HanPSC8_Chr15g0675711 [Helianthus annuus]
MVSTSYYFREDKSFTRTPLVNTTSTQPTSPSSQWMMFDTGALDHVNPDRGSLHSFSEYGGPDEIVLVNGTV